MDLKQKPGENGRIWIHINLTLSILICFPTVWCYFMFFIFNILLCFIIIEKIYFMEIIKIWIQKNETIELLDKRNLSI